MANTSTCMQLRSHDQIYHWVQVLNRVMHRVFGDRVIEDNIDDGQKQRLATVGQPT